MSAEAAQRCGECGVEVRLVHRYPKGQQPERSHPAVAAARGEPPEPAEPLRTWPSRDDFRRMAPAQVNAFLESIGSSWRVADPQPSRAARLAVTEPADGLQDSSGIEGSVT